MTPEERAEKLVLVEAIASSEHTGKYFLRLAGWFAEVLGVSASTNVEGVAKVIRGSIAKAINEALLERWLKTQLEAYRRLLAAMARDNGFQEGYEAGLRAQTKE